MRRSLALWVLPLVLLVLEVPSCQFGPTKATAAIGLNTPVQLQWHFYRYQNTCRDVETYVRAQVEYYWKSDKTITQKLLRLLYSDCFITGCDASILQAGPYSERKAPQNAGLGGFALIDKIKQVVEERCPGVVSCADILNLATRDAAHLAGAPSYPVLTGRRDGMKSSMSSVDLPSPSISWEAALAYFQSRGLDVLDLATLLGAHSLGGTHCRYITDRLYNFNNTGKPDPSLDPTFLKTMQKQCPPRVKGAPDPVVPLNPSSGNKFSTSYFSRIQSHKAVLGVDQQLLYSNDTQDIVTEFAAGFEDFRRSFALSMSRMGSIWVLTGKQGEIRRNCAYTNANNPN